MRASVLLVLVSACGFQVTGGGVGPTTEDAGEDADASVPVDAGTVLDLDALVPTVDAPVDAPATSACGDVGQACCAVANQPACASGGECTDGTCTACGALFQSCCDPGRSCGALGVCIGETCASL